jgi:hypothetical protein
MAKIYVKLEKIEIANKHETIRPTDIFDHNKPGTLVQVRPCGDEYKGRTYLGMYLCSAPTGFIGEQVGDKIVLLMNDYTNPAIYVPELNKIIWGYGSWWGPIKSEDQLRQITDDDIKNIWYVKALKQLESDKSITDHAQPRNEKEAGR